MNHFTPFPKKDRSTEASDMLTVFSVTVFGIALAVISVFLVVAARL